MDIDQSPRKKAVAIKYDSHVDSAPVVIAKGQGELADRIINVAQEYQVTIKEDPELVNYLYSVNLFDQIPVELYGVVAELLAFVYNLDQSAGKHK